MCWLLAGAVAGGLGSVAISGAGAVADNTILGGAQAYAETLRAFYGSDRLDPERPLFDLVLLGLGAATRAHLEVGGQVIQRVGYDGFVAFHWDTIPRVPLALGLHVTNTPAGTLKPGTDPTAPGFDPLMAVLDYYELQFGRDNLDFNGSEDQKHFAAWRGDDVVGHSTLNLTTGQLGVAVQSKFPAVGAIVPAGRAGVGAVATQSLANVRWKKEALDLLAQGLPPTEAAVQGSRAAGPSLRHAQACNRSMASASAMPTTWRRR